jgi:ferredoxin--NADP+ reductase
MAASNENNDWIELTLERRRDWADQLSSFTFSGWETPFTAGQYVTLARTIDGQLIQRHYSVASKPGDPLELYLTIVPEGALTPHLFAMPPGGRLLCWPQPRGKFTIEKVPPMRDLWLVGTGTGLAPFLSMLRSGTLWPIFEHVVLVHSVRYGGDLGYKDELLELVAKMEGRLRYVPATSRERFEGALEGRITTGLGSGALEAAAGLTLSAEHSQVMLCGNPAMLDEMKTRLEARQMLVHRKTRPGNVHLEKYW